MFLVVIRVLVPGLAVLLGVLRFQNMDRSTRLIFFQVFAYMVTLALVKQVMAFQKMSNLDLNTILYYDIYLLFEVYFLTQAALSRFENKYFRGFVLGSSLLLIVSFCIELFYKGALTYCSYSDTFANIFLTIVYGLLLYQEFKREAFVWQYSSFVWISLGVLLFSASTAAYMSIMDYLNALDPNTNQKVFRILFGVTANLKYVLIALGFWLVPSRPSICLK